MKKCFYTLTLLCISFISFSQNWLTTGNSGTGFFNSVGTTDNKSLRFRTNNTLYAILDSTGKFGIGIAVPAYNLDVTGNSRITTLLQVGSSTSYPANTIFSASGGVSMMHFSQGASNIAPSLSIYNTNTSSKGIALIASSSGSALVFDSSGWFGISPELKSNITGGVPAGNRAYYKMSGTGQSIFSTSPLGATAPLGSNVGILNTYSSLMGLLIRGATTQSADLLQLQNNAGTILARIDANGKGRFKGAEFSGYMSSFQLTDSSFTPKKYIDSLSLVQSQSYWKLSGNSGINPAINFIGNIDSINLNFKTNNLSRLKINGNGQMVVGAGSPYSLTPFTLTVTETPSTVPGVVIDASNSSGNPVLELYSTSSSSYYPAVIFKTSNWGTSQIDQYEGLSYSVPASLKHTWYTAGVRQMVLTSTGNLLVGTTTDDGTDKLQVNGSIKATGIIIPTNGGAGKILTSDVNGNASWQAPGQAGNSIWSTSGSDIFNANSNNVGIGIPAPTSKLDVLMTSVSQPALTLKSVASQTANTFEIKDASGNAIIKVRSPDGVTYGQSTLTIDGLGKVNSPALNITNIGDGDAAIAMSQAGGGGGLMLTDFNSNHSPTWRYTNKHAAWWANGNIFDPISPESFLFFHTMQPATTTLMTLRGQPSQTGDMLKVQNSGGTDIFRILSTGGGYFAGNVGIGTTTFSDPAYQLYVEGSIRSRKVRVDVDPWSDYVFDKSYHLPTLTEVEDYIKEHSHLADVPSAAEVEKNGIDLGSNQAVLLKKIEELTLYAIDQNKQINIQNTKLEQQQKQIEELMKLFKQNHATN